MDRRLRGSLDCGGGGAVAGRPDAAGSIRGSACGTWGLGAGGRGISPHERSHALPRPLQQRRDDALAHAARGTRHHHHPIGGRGAGGGRGRAAANQRDHGPAAGSTRAGAGISARQLRHQFDRCLHYAGRNLLWRVEPQQLSTVNKEGWGVVST